MSKIKRCPHCWSASLKLLQGFYAVIKTDSLEVVSEFDFDVFIKLEIPIEAQVDGVECIACGQKSYWKWGD